MVSAMTDIQMMEDVRDGKVERLAVLFERHHVPLFNFFLRLTGTRSISEDLVQDVFAASSTTVTHTEDKANSRHGCTR